MQTPLSLIGLLDWQWKWHFHTLLHTNSLALLPVHCCVGAMTHSALYLQFPEWVIKTSWRTGALFCSPYPGSECCHQSSFLNLRWCSWAQVWGQKFFLIFPSFKQTSFVFGGRRWITCSFRLWGSRISAECCKQISAERNHHVTLKNWVFLRTICKCISDQQSCAVYCTFKITILFLPPNAIFHYTVETVLWIWPTDSQNTALTWM